MIINLKSTEGNKIKGQKRGNNDKRKCKEHRITKNEKCEVSQVAQLLSSGIIL